MSHYVNTSSYRELIHMVLRSIGKATLDPRHVEAFMRLDHPTLGHLSKGQFAHEVALSAECVDLDVEAAERLALSYGL